MIKFIEKKIQIEIFVDQKNMIAIFAGTGDYPKEVINSLKKNNKKFIILNITEKKLKTPSKLI